MKGIIKTILAQSAKKLTEDIQVLISKKLTDILLVCKITSLDNSGCWVEDSEGNEHYRSFLYLNVFIIGYKKKYEIDSDLEYLFIKDSQWQYIIDNNLIGEEVEFNVVKTLVDIDPPELRDSMVGALKTIELAELIIKEEKIYTENEVKSLIQKYRLFVGSTNKFSLPSCDKWIEENLK